MRKGNRLEAMKAYQKLARLKPGESEVRISLAKIYASMNQQYDAFFEVNTVLEQDPRNIEAHLLLRRFARKFNIPADLKESLEQQLFFMAPPKKIRIFQKLHEMEKRKYEKLIEEFNSQLEEDPGNPVIIFNRSKAEGRLRTVEESLQDLSEMISTEIEWEEEIGPDYIPPEFTEETRIPSEDEFAPEPEADEAEAPIEPEDGYPEEQPTGVHLEEEFIESMEPQLPSYEEMESEEIQQTEPSGEPAAEEAPVDQMEKPPMETTGEPAEAPVEEEAPEAAQPEEAETVEEEAPTETEAEQAFEEAPEADLEPEKETPPPPVEHAEEEYTASPERMAFLESINAEIEKCLKAINQTRGVTASLVTDHAGHILFHTGGADLAEPEELTTQVLSGLKPLVQWDPQTQRATRSLLHWVLEFKKGLLMLQPLAPGIYLVVIGKARANFGAVKYSVEKNSSSLVESLTKMPA